MLERLCSNYRASIDVHRRCRVDTDLFPELGVGRDRGGVLVAIEAGVKASGIDLERRRVLLQVGNLHPRLIREDQVVHLPVPVLLSRAVCRLVGLGRLLVVLEREVLEYEADFVAVGGANLRESRTDSRAVRSLIIRKLDDRHRGGCRTDRWIIVRDFDGNAGRLEQDSRRVGFLLQIVHENCASLLLAIAGQK